MTTTRKDIYRIADAFAEAKPDEKRLAGRAVQWHVDVMAVADALNVTSGLDKNGNRRFDYEKFYALCGAR